MNLIEAVKSGRRWRLKGSTNWWSNDELKTWLANPRMTPTELLTSDDYEIEEFSVRITRRQWEEAYKQVLKGLPNMLDVAPRMARILGLEEESP